MASEPPSSRASITSVNKNDVLSGRGSAANEWQGNQAFREIINERRNDYVAARRKAEKDDVAKQVVESIKARNGRFLTREDKSKTFDVEDGVWVELHESEAIEKCKQALRQSPKPRGSRRRRNTSPSETSLGGFPFGAQVSHHAVLGQPSTPILPPTAIPSGLSAADARLLLFQRTMAFGQSSMPLPFGFAQNRLPDVYPSAFARQGQSLTPNTTSQATDPYLYHQPTVPSFQQATLEPSRNEARAATHESATAENVPSSELVLPPAKLKTTGEEEALPVSVTGKEESTAMEGGSTDSREEMSDFVLASLGSVSGLVLPPAKLKTTGEEETVAALPVPVTRKEESTATEEDSADWASNEEMTDFVLASLGWESNHPKFTEEELARELESMTVEERMSTASDMFGKCCSVSDEQPSKRARKDLDKQSIEYLVKQTKMEIERMPEKKKQALVEARKKCRREEFSDARLEQFLRCEGMNSELAAQRFVEYWEARRKVFGPDKYLLPMTLSEAVRDDVTALESGVYSLLPRPDSSGRPILLLDISRNTGTGYTQESLLRAIWYVLEVAAKECLGTSSSDYVFIGWHKNATIWDFSRRIFGMLATFDKSAFPIKFAAAHTFCAPNVVIRTMSPLLMSLMDTRGRSRIIFHDVPEENAVEDLSSYGIEKEMLPSEMGGTVRLCQEEWIANRRALEMEEL